MTSSDVLKLYVAPDEEGMRLDSYISFNLTDCSRSYAATLIRKGCIQVDDASAKPGRKVKVDEQITICLPPPEDVNLIAEPIPLHILFEDRHLLVLNKPPGLVVHPAAGHPTGTLVNGILHHCPDLEGIGGEKRPGIVHRLDKDTSGTIVVAKTAKALENLSDQFKSRSVQKQYLALVYDIPKMDSGTIDLPVGRHPVDRKKMSTVSPRGREALTHWRVKEIFLGAALLSLDIKTGRTHQIRVHCKSIGHPIIGDRVYGLRKWRKKISNTKLHLNPVLQMAKRQMLHAYQLSFNHPETATRHRYEAPIPEDMGMVIRAFREFSEVSE